MAPKRSAAAKAEESSSSSDGNRPRSSSADEKALDPTLAEHGDASDGEMAKPAKKRKTSADSKGKEEDASNGKQSGGYGGAPTNDDDGKDFGAKRHDWNPNPGKLPEDGKTPLDQLRDELGKQGPSKAKEGNVMWVMGMKSLRIEDNRGLAHASQLAKSRNAHLVVVFFISPGDWKMHDRAPQRIDFVLRNLAEVKKQLDELHIPLVLHTQKKRTEIPKDIAKFAKEWGVTNVVGNIEYEVDECWRDIATIKELSKSKVHVDFLEDVYVVPAGVLKTGQGNQYSVFSPWNRSWTSYLSSHLDLVEESPLPEANDQSIRKDKTLSSLFGKNNEVPQSVEGFECDNVDYMKKLWPAGSHAARTVLSNFIKRKGGENGMEAPATGDCWDDVGPNAKESRIGRYGIGRNLVSENGSSRLSPYLSAGVISARACLRATMDLEKGKLKVGRGTGVEMWNTEISFRDFYGHVLAAWPRVSMQRNYILKYEAVVWENNEEHFQRWCEGKTGYPLIDAGMRQLAHSSWQHNRARMACAMFLTKHLLCDWRWGEKHYARHLIDSDLASNNAGWQWSASTGTDPQPYFRVFNPLSQSEKCDPNGEYIRHWLPELRGVKGAAVHDPFNRLSRGEFEKLDYPKPIVEHKAARERAMARFKDPGSS